MAGVQEEEFDEGEVWDVLQDSAGTEAPRIILTPPRNNGRGEKAVSAAVDGAGTRRSAASRLASAPVAIPAAGGGWSRRRRGGDEDDEDAGEMLPPHEWLARKMERMGGVSAAPATPAPEACGGRSKGREMRKVRDAVLPKTAFSEQ